MEFKLNLDIPKSALQLTHKDSVVLLGSCFSDEMAEFFTQAGFTIESNTFGTLFHPTAIANILTSVLDEEEHVNVFQRDDLFFSWDSASKVYSTSEVRLKEKMLELRQELKSKLKKSTLLVVTFGTAWAYRHKSLDLVVGNCHKASSNLFERELSTIELLSSQWLPLIERLKEFNPNLNVVLTVSPVRHKKDGLVNNSMSKARLIELVHQLKDTVGVDYFPSYEILLDELRDYRFYAADLVHPNALAVEYIWKKLSGSLFADETLHLMEEIRSIKTALAHKSLHPESAVNQARIRLIEKKKADFLAKHPEIHF